MKDPLISIVVLNWNGGDHVRRCLQHIAGQSYARIEVIVVDNASSDGSLEESKVKYPGFIFIGNAFNRGYSSGMNQGIEAAKGEFILPINQDAALDAEFVSVCVGIMQRDDTIGVIGGRVFAWVSDTLTHQLRAGEGERVFMRKRFQGFYGGKADGEEWVFAPSGSFPFFRKAMLEDIKMMSGYYYDESFVTGWEDLDLAFRMQLRGWKCLFSPAAFGWHVGSGSVGGKATFFSKDNDYQLRILRNRYFTIIKNLPADTLRWLLPYLFATEIAIIPLFLVRSPRSLIALGGAWRQVILDFPELLAKRKKIQSNVRVEKGYLKKYFKVF